MRVAPGCLHAGALAARRTVGLSDAERLQLEQHLEHCVDCQDEHRRLDLVRQLITGAPVGSQAARGRAIERALATLTVTSRPPRIERRTRWPIALAIASVAAAVIVAIFWTSDRPPHGSEPVVAVTADARIARDAHETVAAPEVVAEAEHAASAGETVTVGRARITFTTNGRYAWHADDEELELREGAATFDVDHGPERFRVTTSKFVVEVLGTRFSVGADSVRVERGTVRVLAPDGRLLDAEVTAGQTWSLDRPTAAPPRVPFRDELERARAALAAKDVVTARRHISTVLAAHPSDVYAAAARNLLAEAAAVSGDRDQAVRLYLEVARRYPKLSAGENALFAAARLQERGDERAAAKRLFEEYVDRYPRGQFATEAAAHLRALEVTP